MYRTLRHIDAVNPAKADIVSALALADGRRLNLDRMVLHHATRPLVMELLSGVAVMPLSNGWAQSPSLGVWAYHLGGPGSPQGC